MPQPLWTPPHPEASRLAGLQRDLAARGLDLPDYPALHAWSLEHPADFWAEVWRLADVRASRTWDEVLVEGDSMADARWFTGARLNYAENLLGRCAPDAPALTWCPEGRPALTLTGRELTDRVAALAATLRAHGVGPGDRIAAFLPNRPEAVVAMLAAASLGAVFSSASPDFGLQGVLDRFGQIEPTVLVATDAAYYGGKTFDIADKVGALRAALPSVRLTLHVPAERATLPGSLSWAEATATPAPLTFAQLPFDHPLYILYSSGTTGTPKAIVHGAGGTLLQHAKEHLLHVDLGPDDAIAYFTTTGWMMWNWLVSALLTGARVVLVDGSPAWPEVDALWRLAARERLTVLGTSPRYLQSCRDAGARPADLDLSSLRAVLSTGAPLPAESFVWVHSHVKPDVHLQSIAGGTDLISCFVLGSPLDPEFAGEIQRPGLGMAVEAWTPDGHPVRTGRGELVCTRPFPSMPVGFWGDDDGTRYRAAYFEHFPGVWRHGDWVEFTAHGGVVMHGRSDATLNPGGVRIGTAEIYRQVLQLDEVTDAVVVGLPTPEGDEEVVLYVVLESGEALTGELEARLRQRIRTGASPRHVPRRILQAPAVPRTQSGKRVELAVRRALLGQSAVNRSALSNPEALDWFSRGAL